jgi:hypothetical protein
MLDGVVLWLWNFVVAFWVSFKDIFTANPVLGLVIIILVIITVYWLANMLINMTHSGIMFMVIIMAVIVLVIVVFVMWTQFGLGKGLYDWLMSIFAGGK